MQKVEAEFTFQNWDEKSWEGRAEHPKLNECKVEYAYTGDVEGSSDVRYLMAYRPDGTSDFVGVEVFTGTLLGRQGECVLRHTGHYDGTMTHTVVQIIEGCGTGGLKSLTGTGQMQAAHKGPYLLHLQVAFADVE